MSDPTNVVELKIKPRKIPHVHECACGCQLFYLLDTGSVECRGCAHVPKNVKFYNPNETPGGAA